MAGIEVLDSPGKYYADVLKPGRDEFFQQPSSFRNAFTLAISLFHFHEWLYEYNRLELEAHFGNTFDKPKVFWSAVEATDRRFGFIRDVANASKHVVLTKRPSTSMSHVANTHITVGTFQRGVFDPNVFSTGGVAMKGGQREISFDVCAAALFQYWTQLLSDTGLMSTSG